MVPTDTVMQQQHGSSIEGQASVQSEADLCPELMAGSEPGVVGEG